ncbi:preprotein translocase subunit SecE [Limisphaera ngatamarikiensis]|uniref:preprotein translocase subunit SecE n=1 Tax=Limisphaera ngatamarikiensis TaxID=1324935 RepID=UPI0031B87AF1
MSELIPTLIWLAILGIVFGVLWYLGYVARFANYLKETREELRKCTWPTWEELKGSTAVVMVATLLLGLFTALVDLVFAMFARHIMG